AGQSPSYRAVVHARVGAVARAGVVVAGQQADLLLLRREPGARRGAAPSYLLPRGDQLPAGAFGERLHADRVQHVVGRAQLLARVDAPTLAAQPLPVQQVRAGQLRAQLGAAQPADRLALGVLG